MDPNAPQVHRDLYVGCDACGDREVDLREDGLCRSCHELQEPLPVSPSLRLV